MAEHVTQASYLLAAVLFILSLRWLNHPSTARRGVAAGVAGMALAIIGTLLASGDRRLPLDRRRDGDRDGDRRAAVEGAADRGAAADRALPCVRRAGGGAGRHGEVRAVAAGGRADAVPHLRDRDRSDSRRPDLHRQPDGRRQASGNHPDPPDHLQGTEHHQSRPAGDRRRLGDLPGRPPGTVVAVRHHPGPVAGLRRAADHPDRRRRHADGDLAAERLRRPGGRRDGVRAREQGAHHRRRARRIVGPDPLDHHVPRDEPLVHQRAVRRVRAGPGRRRGRRGQDRQERHRPRRRGPPRERRLAW